MIPFIRVTTSLITLVGLLLLTRTILDWNQGLLAVKYFPHTTHTAGHHLGGLALSLGVPLHVIFIGLILQKRWLTPGWARFAWVGIVSSGMWLGVTLAVRWWLP